MPRQDFSEVIHAIADLSLGTRFADRTAQIALAAFRRDRSGRDAQHGVFRQPGPVRVGTPPPGLQVFPWRQLTRHQQHPFRPRIAGDGRDFVSGNRIG